MAFNDFVQIELPLRPSVATDGGPGQILVRSENASHPREMVWADAPSGAGPELSREAGEDMAAGTPVYVSGNKFYPADNTTRPSVVGVLRSGASAGFTATATTSGPMSVSGLTDGASYYLGSGVVTSTPPSSGQVIKLGTAISTSTLMLNINLSVLLN